MLRIRLQRTGRRNIPTFRIVLAEHSAPVKAAHQEILGHFLPSRDPAVLEFDANRISYWVGKGAKPTDTVARLLKRSGVSGMDSFIQRYTKQRKKKEAHKQGESTVSPSASPSEAKTVEG